jgi:hypothetical protein
MANSRDTGLLPEQLRLRLRLRLLLLLLLLLLQQRHYP